MRKEILKVGCQKPKVLPCCSELNVGPHVYRSLQLKKYLKVHFWKKLLKVHLWREPNPGLCGRKDWCLPMDYTRRLQRLRAGGWQKILLLFYLLHAFARTLLRIINFIIHYYMCKVVWALYTFTYDYKYNFAFYRVTWSLSQEISTVLLSSSNERIKASTHPAPLGWLQNALLLRLTLLCLAFFDACASCTYFIFVLVLVMSL